MLRPCKGAHDGGPVSKRCPRLTRTAKNAIQETTRFGSWPLGSFGLSYHGGIVGRGRDQFHSPVGSYPGAVA